jgi:aminoglycoside phosphotransferase (APT) family kinase protein
VSSAARLRVAEGPVRADPAPAQHVLVGHSGARIVLHTQGLNSFVRKTASGIAASARLKAQADKQQALWRFGLPVPRVLSQNIDGFGVASFDMAYIPGRTIADAVSHAAPFDQSLVAKAVERMIWLFRNSAGAALAVQLFEQKISQIVQLSAAAAPDIAALHEVRNCGQRLMCRDWRGIPESPCHGDLTLENILLTAGRSIAFIDCDDAFASSYWLDFGKLFQDIDGHWCIRGLYAADMPAVRRVNALQKLEQLRGPLRALAASIDPALPPRLPQLAALNLFRTLPYIQNRALIAFLCQRINHVLEACA